MSSKTEEMGREEELREMEARLWEILWRLRGTNEGFRKMGARLEALVDQLWEEAGSEG
jgi:hypothetical protein